MDIGVNRRPLSPSGPSVSIFSDPDESSTVTAEEPP